MIRRRCGQTAFALTLSIAAIALVAMTAAVGSVDENKNPVVILETDLGEISIEVYEDRAPLSAGSFLAFVDAGYYDNAAFYRTVTPESDNGSPRISIIQGGVLDTDKVLPPVAHETTEQTDVLHGDGVISLARGAPGTGSGAAFFICIGENPGLDFGATRNPDGQGFAAFGRVISGMDVASRIHGRDAKGPSESEYTKGQVLSEFVPILSASRKPKGRINDSN